LFEKRKGAAYATFFQRFRYFLSLLAQWYQKLLKNA